VKEQTSRRIGVFLCGCGNGISKAVDLRRVMGQVEKIPDVVHVVCEDYLCSEEALNRLKEDVNRHSLDRVVLAACHPKESIESLFKIALHEAGINPYLTEWVNIRENCAWVHSEEPEKATEKAVDLTRMAVAKLRLAQPSRSPIPQIDNDKCIKCAVCELVCPYGAVEAHVPGAYLTKINEFLCNGCGICVAACPAMAIELPSFTREQIFAQIEAALGTLTEEKEVET